MIKISPSILSCDYGKIAEELKCMERCGADYMHIDVMDGHFVPNITLGAPIIRCIRPVTDIPFDVHLMISEPLKYIDDFCKAGADIITFHLESNSPADETIDRILQNSKRAGLTIKPATPVEALFPYLDKISLALIMTVEPGFGGQSFIMDTLPKITALRREIQRRGLDCEIEVDGGINAQTVSLAAAAGADVFVSGNAVFSAPDRQEAIASFREKAEKAYCSDIN